jgi:HSP90 family molecular chaperone
MAAPSILPSSPSMTRMVQVAESSSQVLWATPSSQYTALKVNVTDNGIGMTPDEMTENLVRAVAPM